MNKKGFMMAELVVVASIVVVFMAAMYASYAKIYSAYKTRISYYDAVGLYRLAYIRDELIEASTDGTSGLNKMINDAKEATGKYVNISGYNTLDGDANKVYLIYNNKNNLNVNISNIHKTFTEYLTYLSTNANLSNTNCVMVLERCNSTDENNCKYSYLEVHDGQE